MLVVDFLILNRDRHGANIEVLKNNRKKTIRLSPLFDHGLSFLCRCLSEQEIDNFDPMADKPVQCYVNPDNLVSSAQKNLELIPRDRMPVFQRTLTEADEDIIFDGLDNILSPKLKNKIWEMLLGRWRYYENFCRSR